MNFLYLCFSDVMGGDVGVAITSCIFLTGALQFGMRQSAEAENLMTSVERVMEYGELDSEAELTSPEETKPFFDGIIQYDNVSLKYAENSKPVLINISFKTTSCEKIGIVGKTVASFCLRFKDKLGLFFLFFQGEQELESHP